MPLLIDGHNLIPKIPGLSLSDPDDEMQLVRLLQDYCRIQRQQAECFFDKAPLGHPRVRTLGTIKVKFAREGQTADDEIKKRLVELGKQARNFIVVSSDQSIQTAARAARAKVKPSEDFAGELIATLRNESGSGKTKAERSSQDFISPDEVAMWLKAFKGRKKD